MKKRLNHLERLIAKGMLHGNEPAAAPAPAPAPAGGGESVGDTGGGGGESAPSSLESPSSESDGDGGIDWGSMFDGADEGPEAPPAIESSDSQPTALAPEVTPPAAEPAAVPQEPAAAQPPETPPQEPEPVQSPSEQQPAPVETQQQPEQPLHSPEEIAAARQEARSNWHSELSQRYTLSDEQAAAMVSEPNTVFPQMAADLHIGVMESTMQFLRNNLPELVGNSLQQNTSRQEGENAFFSAWPELSEHRDLVSELGAVWRQRNPTASREDFIKQVGPLVWSGAGLSLQDLVNRGAGQGAPTPAAPEAPPQGGYSPAPQGGGGPAIAPPANDGGNIYSSLAEDWQND